MRERHGRAQWARAHAHLAHTRYVRHRGHAPAGLGHCSCSRRHPSSLRPKNRPTHRAAVSARAGEREHAAALFSNTDCKALAPTMSWPIHSLIPAWMTAHQCGFEAARVPLAHVTRLETKARIHTVGGSEQMWDNGDDGPAAPWTTTQRGAARDEATGHSSMRPARHDDTPLR